jgi:hypothetical protein
MRRLERFENQRPGGCTVWIDAANELYIRFGEHSAIFDQMVSEGSGVLPVRAKRIASNPSVPDARNRS